MILLFGRFLPPRRVPVTRGSPIMGHVLRKLVTGSQSKAPYTSAKSIDSDSLPADNPDETCTISRLVVAVGAGS